MKYLHSLSIIVLVSLLNTTPGFAFGKSSAVSSGLTPATPSESTTSDPSLKLAQLNQRVNQVRNRLNRANATANRNGLRKTHNDSLGYMGNGVDSDTTLTLRQGVRYLIVGVCDDYCHDLKIQLYDENGNLIVSDMGNSPVAGVEITPRWTGRFRINTIMARCSSAPCHYGLAAFSR